MDTPWEVIIKQFCRKWGDRGRNTLKEYADDFIDFLHNENFFCDREMQKGKLRSLLVDYYTCVRDEVREEFDNEENPTESFSDKFAASLSAYEWIKSRAFIGSYNSGVRMLIQKVLTVSWCSIK